MKQLESIMRFGYALVIITIILMMWTSIIGAREVIVNKNDPPCTFSPMCTCSSTGSTGSLGIVQCQNTPFPAIPRLVNSSKVFVLHMINTGLRKIDSQFFRDTGMYRLEISHNPVTEIPDDAFLGLDRALWELRLHNNELVEIPSKSIRHLQKLRLLDLSSNKINCVELDSFRGLEESLTQLTLADNSINTLKPDSFMSLTSLEYLDLSGNNLGHIDTSLFRDGMPKLIKLSLADNLLFEIPYATISPLRALKVLDLSYNNIRTIQQDDPNDIKPSTKLTLNTLRLEFNEIESIPTSAFSNFDVLNITFLDGNPITYIGDEAFRSVKIRELYIRHCGLSFVAPNSFKGMGTVLQVLDLSGNNITELPENLLRNFDDFRMINLKDNKLKIFPATEIFTGFHTTLQNFDISGESNVAIGLQDLKRLRNIRSLSLSRLSKSNLSPEDFSDFGLGLEDLKITFGSLTAIKAHAFQNVRSVRRLDLSENKISQIDNEAFEEVGHTLTLFKLSHALASTVTAFPTKPFSYLTTLQNLDVSNNQLKSIADNSFHFMKDLQTLDLSDNHIEQIAKGTFQGDIHGKLETISYSFNSITQISQHSFVDLELLNKLHLNDNRITKIDRRSFMNLDNLKVLSLRGNKITSISEEAFQVYKGDPLPQHLCSACELDVNTYYEKLINFIDLETKWVKKIKESDQEHSYLEARNGLEKENQAIKPQLIKLLPALSVALTTSIKTAILLRPHISTNGIDGGAENALPVLPQSLLALCVDCINKNGQIILYGNLKNTTKNLPQSNPIKKKKKRNREYITRVASRKRMKYLRRMRELRDAQSKNNLLGIKNILAETSTQKRISETPVRRESYVETRETSPEYEEEIDSLKARPRRKVAIPFYIPDNVSTPSPEMHTNNDDKKETKLKGKISQNAGKIRTENRSTIESASKINAIKSQRRKSATFKSRNGCHEKDMKRRKTDPSPVKLPKLNNIQMPLKGNSASNMKKPINLKGNAPRLQDFIQYSNEKKARSKTRVNYSEALVDRVYEEMLNTNEKQDKRPVLPDENVTKPKAMVITVSKTKNDAIPSVGSEITIVPIKKSDDKLKNRDSAPGMSISLAKIKKTFSTNPETVFKINSSVSIQLKSSATKQTAQAPSSTNPSKLTIKSIQSLFDASNSGEKTVKCRYCNESFGNLKLLAMHQLIHMRVVTHKIGHVQILHSKYRKGRMVNLGTEKCIRCLNCWKLYPNSKAILEHWVNGKCLFYCSICGESFHDNIKSIREHFPHAHGIRYRIPERPVKLSAQELHEQKMNQAQATCPVCNLIFANKFAKNSHMRLHKKKKGQNKKDGNKQSTSRVSSPASSVCSTSSSDSKKMSSSKSSTGSFKRPTNTATKKTAVKQRVSVVPSSKISRSQNMKQRRMVPSTTKPPNFPESAIAHTSVKTEYVEDPCFMDISDLLGTNAHSSMPMEGSAHPMDNGAPRLQVKNLQELQNPEMDLYKNQVPSSQMAVCDPYYAPQNSYQDMPPDPNYVNHNMMTSPHMMAVQSTPPPFQISHAQQVQNTQYYNPVFVVHRQQHTNAIPHDTNSYQQHQHQHQQLPPPQQPLPQQSYGGINDYNPHYYS